MAEAGRNDFPWVFVNFAHVGVEALWNGAMFMTGFVIPMGADYPVLPNWLSPYYCLRWVIDSRYVVYEGTCLDWDNLLYIFPMMAGAAVTSTVTALIKLKSVVVETRALTSGN